MPAETTAALMERITGMQNDISEIKGSINVMAAAIQKLAVIEERQANAAAAQERAFGEITHLSTKVERLEAERATTATASKWVDRGIVGVVTAAAIFAAKKIGLM